MEESGHLLPPSVGDPAGGSMEENRDPLPLCHREKMPPCVSSPSAQFVCSPLTAFLDSVCGGSFEKDSIPGTSRPSPSYSPQFSYSPQWFPHLIPTEFDDEETMMSCTLWTWSDDGGQTVSVETMMAGIAMSNHAAAEPVAGTAALSPLRQQNLRPMNLDLDFTTASSKEASGPSPMGGEVAPMAPQPPSLPVPSCTSPSTEHILLPEASRSLAQANDATSVAMAEQGNVAGQEDSRSTGSKQKNQGQLHVLLNFLEIWSTQPKCVEDYYAQAQHSGASGSSVPRSNAQAQLSGASGSSFSKSNAQAQHSGRSKPYPRRTSIICMLVKVILYNILERYSNMALSCSETGGTSHLRRHVLSRHKNYWDLQPCSQPPKTPQKIEIVEMNPISLSRKRESENENEHIELGNNNMEVQPGDMSRNHTDDMEVEPGDIPREPIVDMDVDSAKVKDVSQSNELYPLIEGSSSQVENIPGNFTMLDAAIGIKESRQNENKVKVAGTQLMSWKRPPDISCFMNDHPRSGENGGDNELNEVDHKDVKVETGNASRKRKKCASESESESGSESEAWLHFARVRDASGVVMEGKCNYCGKVLKAHPKRDGTSRLRRHAERIHGIELKSRSPKTKERRVATTTKAKVTQPSAPDKVPSDVIMLEDSGGTVDKISRLELQLLHRINSTPEQEVLVQIDDVTIRKKALETLADSELEDGPPRYLQDDIIDAYIYILKDKNKDDTRAHGRVYIETTVGCQQLLYGRAFSIGTKKNRGIKYLKHDMLKKMKQCLELASNEVQSNSWPDYKLASWKVTDESQIPKQIDMSSCGLYVIKYMEYWTGEKMSKTFTQADIELFRLKLAAELLSSPLNKA